MHRTVLCRIGWMTYYNGVQPGDRKPVGGGSYNVKHVGHEACNFRNINSKVLGYVQYPGYKFNIQRIDPKAKGEKVGNVLVIFFATNPKTRGQQVIGWYKHATILVEERRDKTGERDRLPYNIIGSITHAVLLPTEYRVYALPKGKGGVGQSNVVYVLNDNGKPKKTRWLQALMEYVSSYEGPNLIREPEVELIEKTAEIFEKEESTRTGQGFSVSGKVRVAVEKRSMRHAARYYEKRGYVVSDVSKVKPYDLLCSKGKKTIHVEVKGTQGSCESIFLPQSEVKHALKFFKNTALFVVYAIKVRKMGRNITAYGGRSKVTYPWRIDKSKLRPFSYIYEL